MKNCPTCGAKPPKKMEGGGLFGNDDDDEAPPTPEGGADEEEGGDDEEEEAPSSPQTPGGAEAPDDEEGGAEDDGGEEEEEKPEAAPPTGLAPAQPPVPGAPPPPPKPGSFKDVPVIDVIGKRRPDFVGTGGKDYNLNLTPMPPPPPTPQQMNADDLGLASDLQLGKITPKTYQSLYNSKDTLGKVGTLFGLLLSGVGSGLSGQPNALMEMMNKEIERDLDAQKASNTNAQNWFNLSNQHEYQKAQINRLAYENEYTKAQTGKVPYEENQMQAATEASLAGAYQHATEGDLTRGKIQTLGGKSFDLSASNSARNKMLIASQQHLQDTVNAMSPGDTKVEGQKLLDGTVKPAMMQQIVQNNAKTAGQLSLLHAATGGKPGLTPTVDPSIYNQHLQEVNKANAARTQVDNANRQTLKQPGKQAPADAPQGAVRYDKLRAMIADSRRKEALGLPGSLKESDISALNTEAQGIEDNRIAAKAYQHAFTTLNKLKDKGGSAMNEEMYKAQVGTLGAQIARETAGRFNLQEAQNQMGGMFPSWKDFISGAGPEKYNNTMQYFKGKEAGTSTLNRYPELKTPFPKFASPFANKDKEKAENAAMVDWAKANPEDKHSAEIIRLYGGK